MIFTAFLLCCLTSALRRSFPCRQIFEPRQSSVHSLRSLFPCYSIHGRMAHWSPLHVHGSRYFHLGKWVIVMAICTGLRMGTVWSLSHQLWAVLFLPQK